MKMKKLEIGDYSLNATSWKFFELDAKEGEFEVKITPSNGSLHVYTYKHGLPSRSFYTWYLEAESDNELQFYVSRKGSGNYIALFNPDFDKQVTVSVNTTYHKKAMKTIFWVLIICFAVLIIIAFFIIFYCFKSKMAKKKQKRRLLSSERECNLELSVN